jgi:hypothetical protein
MTVAAGLHTAAQQVITEESLLAAGETLLLFGVTWIIENALTFRETGGAGRVVGKVDARFLGTAAASICRWRVDVAFALPQQVTGCVAHASRVTGLEPRAFQP